MSEETVDEIELPGRVFRIGQRVVGPDGYRGTIVGLEAGEEPWPVPRAFVREDNGTEWIAALTELVILPAD